MHRAVHLVSSAFEDSSFETIERACRGWAEVMGVKLSAHNCRHGEELPEEVLEGGCPVLLHLSREFRPSGQRPFLHPHSVRVFERYAAEPWLVDGFGDTQLVHGRGLKGFKWALRIVGRQMLGQETKISYGRHPDQIAWLQRPPGRASPTGGAVVVFVHGGFWGDAISTDHMIALADFFCTRGFISVNVETRRGDRFDWEQGASDVCAAISQVIQMAPLLGSHLSRVVIIGHSSGAHLAHCALALYAGVLRARGVTVSGLVSLAGILDLETACRLDLGDGAVRETKRRATERRPPPATWNPLLQEVDVPILAVHGDKDEVVPIELSRRFVERAGQAGGERALLEVAGCDHMDIVKPELPHWRAVLAWVSNNLDDRKQA